MKLIDTHLHLIFRDRLGYAWTKGMAPLAAGDFTLGDAQRLYGGRVSGSIFMEVGVDDADYQREARMVADMVREGLLLGQIASCRPEMDAGFAEWIAECGSLGVVGFRRILHVVDDAMSLTPGFRANVRTIGAAGYPFDINFLARQLRPIGVELVRACPEVTFVLDHCGVPDIAGGGYEEWASGMAAIAAEPNVNVKISGITAYCAPGEATAAAVMPYLEHTLSVFGADRAVWGSDWPVVNLGAGLPGWLEMSEAFLGRLSEGERAAIGEGNARRIYLRGRG